MPYPAKLTREQILEAARNLLENAGSAALSMRTLAEALGVRPSSLYRHFESQGAILGALGDEAALTLNRQLLETASEPPRQALESAAQSYLDFARAHPHLYALLLTDRSPTTPEKLQTSAGKQLWNTLLLLIGRLSGNPDDTDHTVAFWTFLHGFVTLEASGVYGKTGPRGGFKVGLKALLDATEAAQ